MQLFASCLVVTSWIVTVYKNTCYEYLYVVAYLLEIKWFIDWFIDLRYLFVKRFESLNLFCYFNIDENWCFHNAVMSLFRYHVKRSVLLIVRHRQHLMQNIIFQLYFGQNWPILCRCLSAIAELLDLSFCSIGSLVLIPFFLVAILSDHSPVDNNVT